MTSHPIFTPPPCFRPHPLVPLAPPQSGFKESVSQLLDTIKQQRIQGLGDTGTALAQVFEYVHLYRMNHQVDNIGGVSLSPVVDRTLSWFFLSFRLFGRSLLGGPCYPCSVFLVLSFFLRSFT